jgi:hypothetical protein
METGVFRIRYRFSASQPDGVPLYLNVKVGVFDARHLGDDDEVIVLSEHIHEGIAAQAT